MIRPLPLLAGFLALAVAWTAPLAVVGLDHFSAHMLRHMCVVAIAAPLLVLGLPALAPRLAVPALIATLAEFVIVWGWHLPALHEAARLSSALFAAEQLSFLAAGLMLWASALDPERPLIGAGAMLLTSMHMTLLGALITLAPKAIYAMHGGMALADQQLGGMIMLAVGTPVYLIAGLLLVAKTLGRDPGIGPIRGEEIS